MTKEEVIEMFNEHTVRSIDANELDSIISSLYGKDPEIEVHEDDLYDSAMEVEPEFEESEWEDFMENGQYPGVPCLLGKLVKDEIIPNGDYLINSTD
jgi:hypothetical protein